MAMGNVVKTILIGIAYKLSQKSVDEVNNSVDKTTTKFQRMGDIIKGVGKASFAVTAAVLAGALDFANLYDPQGKFAKRFKTDINFIGAWERTLRHAGGEAGEFLAVIQKIYKLQSQTPADKAKLLSGGGTAGIAPHLKAIQDASTPAEGMNALAQSFSTLNTQQQEYLAGALGLTDAMVLLLREGNDSIQSQLELERARLHITLKEEETAQRLADAFQDIETAVESIQKAFTAPVYFRVANGLETVAHWLERFAAYLPDDMEKALVDSVDHGGINDFGTAWVESFKQSPWYLPFQFADALGRGAGSLHVGTANAAQAYSDLYTKVVAPAHAKTFDHLIDKISKSINFHLYIDGKPIEAIVQKGITKESQQAIEASENSTGG